MQTPIRRAFVDVPEGQVHVRTAGEGGGRPLVLIHQSPGSSRQLEELMGHLAAGRRVIAPDTLGNGDSSPPAGDTPSISDFARASMQAVEQLICGPFDLYGSHTGASIAMEMAIAAPERVGGLVLDGMGVYASDEQSDILDRYARRIEPDLEGTHLLKVWHFCRDQFLFWPYYDRTAAARLPNGLPEARAFHAFTTEVFKALETYHLSYRAAFRHPKRDRLPLIRVPTLSVCSPSDMLWRYHAEVAPLIPGCASAQLPLWDDPEAEKGVARVITRFLDGL